MVKFKWNPHYNLSFRLRVLNLSICFWVLGYLAAQSLNKLGYITFGVFMLLTLFAEYRLIKLERQLIR